MKRRTFFQQAGVLLAGATAAAGAEGEESRQPNALPANRRPTVLLTSAGSDWGNRLADVLGGRFPIRPAHGPLFRDKPDRLQRLLDGVSAIVHGMPPGEESGNAEPIDQRARETYDVLTVAAAKGVELVVYLSSLQMMAGYDPRFQVDEDWRPAPTTEPGQLSHYLAECVCREFARERKLRAIVLRMGEVAPADAARAVQLALEAHFGPRSAGLRPWTVVHIAAAASAGRFPTTRAERILGYRPQPGPST